MSEQPADIREDRLVPPAGRGVEEPAELRESIKSATRLREEKLAGALALADEMAEESGEVTEDEIAALRVLWPMD